jgi:hypothetical protein
MEFLTHFQLPIRYETDTKIFNFLRKSSSNHISDHIHEWRQWIRLIKAPILNQLLEDCFTKSLLPPIYRDVTMGDIFTEEKAISCAQYLDLVYSYGTLYDMIPHSPLPLNDPKKPTPGAHDDGIVGFVKL